MELAIEADSSPKVTILGSKSIKVTTSDQVIHRKEDRLCLLMHIAGCHAFRLSVRSLSRYLWKNTYPCC